MDSRAIFRTIARSFNFMGPQEPPLYMFDPDSLLRKFIEEREIDPRGHYDANREMMQYSIAFDRMDVFMKCLKRKVGFRTVDIIMHNRIDMFDLIDWKHPKSSRGEVLFTIAIGYANLEMFKHIVGTISSWDAEMCIQNTMEGICMHMRNLSGYYTRCMDVDIVHWLIHDSNIVLGKKSWAAIARTAITRAQCDVADLILRDIPGTCLGNVSSRFLDRYNQLNYKQLESIAKYLLPNEEHFVDEFQIYRNNVDPLIFLLDHFPIRWGDMAGKGLCNSIMTDTRVGSYFQTFPATLQTSIRRFMLDAMSASTTIQNVKFMIEIGFHAREIASRVKFVDRRVIDYLKGIDSTLNFPFTISGDLEKDIACGYQRQALLYPALTVEIFKKIGPRHVHGFVEWVMTYYGKGDNCESLAAIAHMIPAGSLHASPIGRIAVEYNTFEEFEFLIRNGAIRCDIDESMELPPKGHPWRKETENREWILRMRYGSKLSHISKRVKFYEKQRRLALGK